MALPRTWVARTQSIHPRTLLLVAIVLLLPLEVSKVLFPISQVEFSRVLMAGAIVWEARRVVAGARPIPRLLGWAIAAVVIVIVGSAAWTRWAEGWLLVAALLMYLGFFVFAADALQDARSLAIIGVSIVVSAAAISLLAIAQRIGGFYIWREGVLNVLGRSNATFGDPNILARFLDVSLAVAIGLVFVRPWTDRRVDLVLWACVALMAAALVQTESRVGWLLLVLVLVAWAVISVRRPRVLLTLCIVAFTFFLTTAADSTASNRADSVVQNVTQTIGSSGEFAGGPATDVDLTYRPPRIVVGHSVIRNLPLDSVRAYLLEAGLAMWEDHPLFGVGTGGFQPEILGDYRGFIPGDRLSAPVSLPHTSLSQVAAENGLVGLVAVFVLAAAVILTVGRGLADPDTQRRVAAYSIGIAIAVIALSSQMEGRLFNEPYLWLALGGLAALERHRRLRLVPRQPPVPP